MSSLPFLLFLQQLIPCDINNLKFNPMMQESYVRK